MTAHEQLLLEMETARMHHAWAKGGSGAWGNDIRTDEVCRRIPHGMACSKG